MNINDAFPSKYLKAADLPEDGAQQFTIEGVRMEEIGMDKDRKPVIYFEDDHKGLVCNKTNANTIAKVLGSQEFEDWIGKQISLYRCEVQFQGDMVEAIRVKVRTPKKPHRPVDINEPSSDEFPPA